MKDFLILKGANVELTGAPETISVLPLGHVLSSKGDFDVDEESFRAMKDQIAQRGVDLVVDYEHQTLKGCEAPAAGWVKALKLEDGAIKADVEWTERGAEYLKNKEYRYLSPVVNVRRSDNKAIGLHSLALTNTPAIEGMTPIVNSQNFEGGSINMEFIKKLAEMLGLGEDATEEQVLESLKACLAENKSLKDAQQPSNDAVIANKAVCELLGLKAGAQASDVSAKIMELKGGTIDGVKPKEKPAGGAFTPKTRQSAAKVPGRKAAPTAAKGKTATQQAAARAKLRVQRNAQRKLLQQSTQRTAKRAADLSRRAAM